MPPSEIRREARESLKGKWGKAVCITLAFLAFSKLIGFVQNLVGEGTALYNILEIAFLVIEIPLFFGLIISFIKLKRDEEVSTFAFLKEGFSRFGKSWGIAWHTFIRVSLPLVCLLLLVLLQLFLMFGNVDLQPIPNFTLLYVTLLCPTIIYSVCRSLLYVLAYYISYDNPELTSKECVKKSEELMKGNRGNYFLLQLSFMGWVFLTLFSFRIGLLWLTPYMQIATICFYEKIANVETKNAEPAEKVEE